MQTKFLVTLALVTVGYAGICLSPDAFHNRADVGNFLMGVGVGAALAVFAWTAKGPRG